MKLLPNQLKPGDTIGIVAPSSAIIDYKDEMEKQVQYFEHLGYKVKLSKNIYKKDGISAGTPEERASDINEMFRNEEIKAIICAEGGNTANGVLPLLDYDLIKENPKIFLGISDITVLINGIYAKTGLITYHGNNALYGYGEKSYEYQQTEFNNRLLIGEKAKIPPYQERKSIREGIAEGKLVGGNLRCFLNLAGTPYFPDCTDSILFLEAYKITDFQCDYMLEHLKQMGVFNQVKGVIIGYIYGLQHGNPHMTQMEEVLLKVTKNHDFPILKCNDFGHEIPNTVLPIGVQARINTQELSIELLEKSVLG
jgi:muramoyltetrapeptide carboxypeptidase